MSRCARTIVTSAAILASTAVYAQSHSSPAPSGSGQAQSDVEIVARQLCQADPVIGTRIPVKRKCNTPAELAEYERQAREFIENYRRRACVAGTTGGDTVVQGLSC